MKNLKKNIGVLSIIFAVILAIAIVWFMIQGSLGDYNSKMIKKAANEGKLAGYQKQKAALEAKEAEEAAQLQKLKPFYEAGASDKTNDPAIYGTMFDEIIKIAQSNGLMIRSIETDMNPVYDLIFSNYPDQYFACEFKLFFVGSYSQLQSYLSDIHNNFKYLISISKLSVTSFSENPDYLLIKISFTLYAKKKVEEKRAGGMFKENKKGKK